MLWFVVAAALAQDAPIFIDPSVRVEDASRGHHIVVPGEIGVRATVYEMGARMEDVTLVTAEVRRGVQPPLGSVQDGSGGPWRQVFGRDTLTVRQQRLGGGHLAAEYRSSEAGLDPAWEPPSDRICASGSRIDSRPVDLRTWDEGVRPHAGVTGPGTSMYWVDGADMRTALVYLAPGDSVTIVEVLDAPRRHPKRRIDVVRDQGHLEIRESDRRQQVCVEG